MAYIRNDGRFVVRGKYGSFSHFTTWKRILEGNAQRGWATELQYRIMNPPGNTGPGWLDGFISSDDPQIKQILQAKYGWSDVFTDLVFGEGVPNGPSIMDGEAARIITDPDECIKAARRRAQGLPPEWPWT